MTARRPLASRREIIAALRKSVSRGKNTTRISEERGQFLSCRRAASRRADLAVVAFMRKPFLKFKRILLTYLAYAPLGLKSFLKSMPLWLKEKLYMKDIVHESLVDRLVDRQGYDGDIVFPEHHESHAASLFSRRRFRSAILTMGGVGEWATASFGVGKGHAIELLADIRFPHSLGLLYSAFTYLHRFRVNSASIN